MPKEIDYKKAIPDLYKIGHLETALFYWVSAQRKILPHVTLEQSINSFLKTHDIDEEEFKIGTAMMMYERTLKKLYDAQRIKS